MNRIQTCFKTSPDLFFVLVPFTKEDIKAYMKQIGDYFSLDKLHQISFTIKSRIKLHFIKQIDNFYDHKEAMNAYLYQYITKEYKKYLTRRLLQEKNNYA